MAKKLKKDTAIAKAKSLKTNVTRKFAVGGTGDPIKVSPTIEKPVQPFPEFYNADKETFDAADNSARSYMTDWFSKRATAFPEKHGEAANAMGSYLQNSGQGAYVPAGTEFKGVGGTADSYGFANEPDYRLSLDQSTATKALSDNPFSFPQSGGKIKGSNAPLNYNTAYYIGEGGKMPTTQLEEQLHLASNYGEHMSSNHTGSFKKAGEYINAEAIGKMGYPGIEGNEEYYGDPQEFYPRLMSARRTFGLDPSKEYTQQEMSGFLDKGYNDLIKGNITEPGQKEHLIEFYQQLGYPTPSAGFTQGASKEEIEKQKQEAAEKFRKSNNEFAMQKNAEDYGLPQTARYGGYQTYKTGGANKKNVGDPPKGLTWEEYLKKRGVTDKEMLALTQEQIDRGIKQIKRQESVNGQYDIKNDIYNNILASLVDDYNKVYPLSENGSRSTIKNVLSDFNVNTSYKKLGLTQKEAEDLYLKTSLDPALNQKYIDAYFNNRNTYNSQELKDKGNGYRDVPVKWVDAYPKQKIQGIPNTNTEFPGELRMDAGNMFRMPILYNDKMLGQKNASLLSAKWMRDYYNGKPGAEDNTDKSNRDEHYYPAIYPKPNYSIEGAEPVASGVPNWGASATINGQQYTVGAPTQNSNFDQFYSIPASAMPGPSAEDVFVDTPDSAWMQNYKNKMGLYNITQENLARLKEYDPNYRVQSTPLTKEDKRVVGYENQYTNDPSVGFYQTSENETLAKKPCKDCGTLQGSTSSADADNYYQTYDVQYPSKGILKPKDLEKSKEHYTIKHSGNPGQSYLWKYTDDGKGGYNQELQGSVFNRDFLNDEQQAQFDSPTGGTAVVNYDPAVHKVYQDQRDVTQTIEDERGVKQNAQNNLNREQQKIEQEKAAREQWEKEQKEKQNKRIAEPKNVAIPPGGFAMGGFEDPEDPGDPKVSLKSKSKSGQGSYVINQTLYDNGSQEGSTRRSLKGFVKGAPKPGTPGAPAKRFESGGENYMKNMLNANSVTGPRTKHVWQDPGQAPYYFNHGGLKNQVVKKFRAAGFETDPPPVAPVTLPVDENYKMRQDYAAAMAALDAQRLSYAKRLEDEQARVKKVRANVVPTARKLDYDDSHLSEEAMNAFYRSTSAKNPTELAAAKKAYPQELRNVLPTGGNYNIADWDEAAGDWKQGKGPDRELYCTPYGCFTYQKAGAKDVPNISGNFGFTGGVEDGTLPFKKVSDKEAEPGDMAIVYGSAPMNYTDQSAGYGIRPHHTTVLSDKNPIVRDEKGNVEGINMFNATNGMRLGYEEQFYPVEDHFGFYRYVGQIPKLEKEGKGFPIREKEIEDVYNARHAAWVAQQPIPEMMAMKEPGQLRTQGMPMVTSQLQKSSFPSFEQPNKKVKKTKIKI